MEKNIIYVKYKFLLKCAEILGSYIKRKEEVWHIGVIPAQCVDTTGAGDLYASGFLYGMSCGYDLQRCGNLGALVSGKIVEVVGPKLPRETWNLIKESI